MLHYYLKDKPCQQDAMIPVPHIGQVRARIDMCLMSTEGIQQTLRLTILVYEGGQIAL